MTHLPNYMTASWEQDDTRYYFMYKENSTHPRKELYFFFKSQSTLTKS